MAGIDVQRIAQLGADLGSSLDLHSETSSRAKRRGFPKLASLVNSTSFTLRKLRKLFEQEPKTFTEACIDDIYALAHTCNILYRGILVLLVENPKDIEGYGNVGLMTSSRVKDLLSSLAKKSFLATETMKWLEPRLIICQQELKRVKFELMLRFLIGSIAQHQLSVTAQSPGDWEGESSLRRAAETIARRRFAYHENFVEKRERWTKEIPVPSPKNSLDGDKESIATVSRDSPAGDKKEPKPEATDPAPKIAETPVISKKEYNPSCSETSSEASSSYATSKNWFQRLFSRTRRSECEWEDLEAYTLHIGYSDDRFAKLPLQDEDIRSALRKLTTKRFWTRRPGLMEQYTSFDPVIRQKMDRAILTVKQKSNCAVTLVGISTRGEDSRSEFRNGTHCGPGMEITLFFELGFVWTPINFINTASGRESALPYISCVTVEMMKKNLMIPRSRFPPGELQIFTTSNVVVTPETWDSIRHPGMTLKWVLLPYGLACPPPHIKDAIPKIDKMQDIYQEINNLLKLSRSWTPDEATMKKSGLGCFLETWTNAVDTRAEDRSDDEFSLSDYTDEDIDD
ncbi:hypothetical protein FLONG3_3582 [Fusarium longipes]|uniref:Ubiquitin-like domain-containing protein n=1 Tax=Fusarium longipes TaxID=694270 RepID=A0A395T175_9HYPO|nr:hypothetical protein FLONG3_3582 [Fusarium longipes]